MDISNINQQIPDTVLPSPDPSTAPLHLHVLLPPAVYSKYMQQTIDRSIPLSRLLSDRLTKFVDSTDEKPIVFTDVERRRIESVLKRNFSSASELTDAILLASKVEIGNLHIQLYPKLAQRLESRAMNQPLEKFISKVIIESLEAYVGLR